MGLHGTESYRGLKGRELAASVGHARYGFCDCLRGGWSCTLRIW